MAIYRKIDTSFWQDGFILDLSAEEKYFYLYLMTNSKTSQCGIYEIHKRIMMLETGYSGERINNLLKKFIDSGKILYDEETSEVFLLNWVKFNWSNSEKVIAKVNEELKGLKNQAFAYHYHTLCKEYGYSIDTLWIPEPQEKEEEEEKEEETQQEKKDTVSPGNPVDEASLQTADQMVKIMQDVKPGCKVPSNLQPWAKSINRMVKLDSHTHDQILELFRWAQHDDFWAANIRSPDKLRAKWDQLELVRQRKKPTKGRTQSPDNAGLTDDELLAKYGGGGIAK